MFIPNEIELKQRENHFYPFVRVGDDIIGYIKIGQNQVYVLDFDETLTLPSNSAMIYDTFVLPEYRKHGVASFLLMEIIDFLRKEGFQKVWCHIPSWNKPSINTYVKAGFRKVDHVRYKRFLCWKFFSRDVTKMLQDSGCSFSEKSCCI